jgi:pyruvate formate-lyase/glycerol dehydratase family glycyl radical enzyme
MEMAVRMEERKTLQLSHEMAFKGKALRAAEGAPYAEGVKIDVERPRLFTESYKMTEGEPMVIRRAKALAHYLDNMTIFIQPWELIVGNFAASPSAIQYYPELFTRWLDRAIDNEYRDMVSDEERDELHEIHKYWKNKSVHGMERRLVPEEVKPYITGMNHGAFFWLHGSRTGVPNYHELFKLGLNGIIKKAEDRLKEISGNPEIYIKGEEYLRQKRFLEAAIISLEAGIRWGKRYAALARELAQSENDEARRSDLEKIAEICDWVPGNAPRGLHEALQSYFFITLITRVIDLQTSGLGDRFDQIMYPIYKKEKEGGRITPEEAQVLIEYLFLKMNEFGEMVPPVMGSGTGGGFVVTTRLLTIGGITPEGEDATNDISSITLKARTSLPLTQPTVAIRVHKDTPDYFLHEMTDAILKQPGVYSLFTDEMMIPFITSLGVPERDARDYSKEGCMRWILPGKAMGQRALGGMFSLPRVLEYALSQGVNKSTGKLMGAVTPDPRTFKSADDVMGAYLEQFRFFVEKCVAINNVVEALDNEFLPQPFLSALMDDCIERGEDLRTYKYLPNSIIQPVGQITVINSIVAMKKLIFEDKKVTMEELLKALEDNWEGHEKLRQMFIHAPKFGNDDDYVDEIASKFYKKTTEVVRSFKDIYGGSFREDGTGGSTYFAGSLLTGATPDGRRAFDLFNDGTISPTPATDKEGPTAVLNSIGKIDHVNGFTNCLNQKFAPDFLQGENKEKFVAYLKAFIDMGIHHIQFNIFDQETLRKAQENPQEYSTIVVRVAGYSAYFTDLNKSLQDQIIARTRQSF